jgi:ABC-2 type transport system permease protein
MTTTAAAPASTKAPAHGNGLTGTGTLLRFNLRRDRIRLPAWVLGITLVQVGGAASYPDLYPTAADRQNQATIVGDLPAMKAMTGPGHGLDDYTYGAMMTNEYLGFMVIFVALMAVFTVVRHTRTEEETGRAELVRASVVGRHAPLAAALATAAVASVVLGLLVAAGMTSLGIDTVDGTGSLVFGAAFAAVGLVFAGIAAVTAQVTEYGRAASGMAGALIAVAYLLRALGDVAGNGLSWLSPIGWAQASAAYVENNWWPIGLSVVVAAALTVAAIVLSGRRDLGAGLRSGRAGAAEASRMLGTPLGFAWRLQRSGALWWGIAMLLFGLAYGSAIDVIEDYADNQVVQDIVANIGGATLTESWLAMIISLLAIICTIFAIIAASRPRREETAGRAEPVLGTALSRTRWIAAHVVIALVGGAVLLLIAGATLGLGAAATSGDGAYVGRVIGAALAYTPAVWLTTALTVAAFGVLPRAAGIAWALLGYAVFVVYLGSLLNLPGWLMNLSPYQHVPRLPASGFTATPLIVLTLIAAGLLTVGFAGFRRRDLEAT